MKSAAGVVALKIELVRKSIFLKINGHDVNKGLVEIYLHLRKCAPPQRVCIVCCPSGRLDHLYCCAGSSLRSLIPFLISLHFIS
jgi:hypothetical protein